MHNFSISKSKWGFFQTVYVASRGFSRFGLSTSGIMKVPKHFCWTLKKKALCFLLTTQLYLSQFPICYWWIYVFVFLVLPHRQLCDLHRFSNFLERYLWHRSLDSAILMQYIKKGWWSPHFTVEFLLIILSPFHIHSAVKNSRKKKMARSKAWNCQNDFRSISLGNL